MICHQPTNLLVSEMRLSLWSFPYHQKKVNCMPITQIHGRATKWITLGALEPARLHWPKWQAHITSLSFQWKSPSVVERLWEVAAFTVLRYFWLLWAYWSFPGKKTLDWPALKKTYQSDESKWEFVATITSQQATKFPVKTNKTTECCHKFRRIFKSHLVNAWRFKTRNSPNSHPFFWLKIGTWEVKISHHHILGCGTPPKRTIRSSPAEAAIQLLLAPEQVEASMCIVFVMRCKFKKSYSLTWDRSSKKNKLLFNYATWKSWILTEIQRNLSGFSGPSMLSNSYFVGAQIV